MGSIHTQITDYLWTQSWQIMVLAVVIAVAAFALKNKSAHVRYLLWLIVLAKCLVPPLLTIPLAILPEEGQAEQVTEAAAEMSALSIEAVDVTVSEPLVLPSAPVATLPAPTFTERLARVAIQQWLAFGWIIGATVFVLAVVIRALRTNRWLRRDRRQLPASLQTEIENFFADLGIRTFPKVWLLDGISQPFVCGLLRGNIYLPANFARIDSPENRVGVLGHELSHVLRFDAAVNVLQIIAQAVFWFHPFVWWANKRIRAEREKCCDEMAIAQSNALPKAYSTAIVNTLIVEHKSTQPVPSLAVAGPVKNIEDRIKTVMHPGKKFYKRPSLITTLTILALALIAVPTTLALTARTGGKTGVEVGAKRAGQKTNRQVEVEDEQEAVTSIPEVVSSIRSRVSTGIILLGMEVADVTPEIQKFYELYHPYGVVILNPGFGYQRLDIGELEEGYYFWMVGNKRIHNVREMIAELVRIHSKRVVTEGGSVGEGYNGLIRVVYGYGKKGGTNTQYLRLTDEDAAELRRAGKAMGMSTDKLYQPGEAEIEQRIESAKKLQELGKALLMYANDHEERYPDTLQDIQSYLRNEQDLQWILRNVEYLGKGKTARDRPDKIIAHDKTLLKKCEGTNVLFVNGLVEFCRPDRLEKLGVVKPVIEIESRFLLVPADANEIKDFFEKENLTQTKLNQELTYCFLDSEQLNHLLQLGPNIPGYKVLTSPKVRVFDGEDATLTVESEVDYISGYTEPNFPSDEPDPKHDSVTKGTRIQLMPKIQPDNKNILLKFDLELSDIARFEKRMYKQEYPYEIPEMEMISINTRLLIPDGQTLLIAGQEITAEQDDQIVRKELLVLIEAEQVGRGNAQVE